MGYGSKALEILNNFYQGKCVNLEAIENFSSTNNTNTPNKKTLLHLLTDLKQPSIDYLGTSFGLTLNLYNFWNKNSFIPLYLSSRENSITGEYSCIMVNFFNNVMENSSTNITTTNINNQ